MVNNYRITFLDIKKYLYLKVTLFIIFKVYLNQFLFFEKENKYR